MTDACPSWCVADHDAQRLPGDRFHQNEVVGIPAVLCTRHGDGQVVAGEIALALEQAVGDRDTWVALATETDRLELTLESARRLLRALDELLADGLGTDYR